MGATAALASTALSSGGKMFGGQLQRQSDNYTAGILHQEAGASVASGIQGLIADKRMANYVASNAAARAGASGVSGSSPSVINVIGNIQSEGEYKALTSLYAGEDRAQELETRAGSLRREGNASAASGWMSGISSVLSGGVDWYRKYGGAGAPA